MLVALLIRSACEVTFCYLSHTPYSRFVKVRQEIFTKKASGSRRSRHEKVNVKAQLH